MARGPSIILASGGMLNGGTSLEYFKAMAEDPRNALIFVGYNSINSLGRKIQNGFKQIALQGENGKMAPLNINMQIRTAEGFSGHSDRRELMNFAQSLRPPPKKVFTMHGEEQKCEDLARSMGMKFHLEARAPMNLDSIRFK